MTAADEPEQRVQFDAEPILAVLQRHGVEYVLVGGYAARMHGSTRPTRDVDVTPATTAQNLDRLAAALRELDARIRTEAVPEGLPFTASGESLIGQRMLNLQTRHGELDLAVRPAAFEGGYDELVERSSRHALGDVQVRVAALEDIIRSKETAARDKDVRALPELYRLANIDRQSEPLPGPPPAAGDQSRRGLTAAERIAAARAARGVRRRPWPGRATASPGRFEECGGRGLIQRGGGNDRERMDHLGAVSALRGPCGGRLARRGSVRGSHRVRLPRELPSRHR